MAAKVLFRMGLPFFFKDVASFHTDFYMHNDCYPEKYGFLSFGTCFLAAYVARA